MTAADVVPPDMVGVTYSVECHHMDTFRIVVKDKGRAVLPVALQRACGFGPGDELVARPLGHGRFIVESPAAVLDRIWSRLPAETSTDATAGLEDWRADSNESRRTELESADTTSSVDSDRRAARLLSELGL